MTKERKRAIDVVSRIHKAAGLVLEKMADPDGCIPCNIVRAWQRNIMKDIEDAMNYREAPATPRREESPAVAV